MEIVMDILILRQLAEPHLSHTNGLLRMAEISALETQLIKIKMALLRVSMK